MLCVKHVVSHEIECMHSTHKHPFESPILFESNTTEARFIIKHHPCLDADPNTTGHFTPCPINQKCAYLFVRTYLAAVILCSVPLS